MVKECDVVKTGCWQVCFMSALAAYLPHQKFQCETDTRIYLQKSVP